MDKGVREKRATLADVAKLAGVSRSLVSLAIRGEGYVRVETRARIMEAAARLDYHPNLIARSLASSRTGHIGVLVGQVTNPLQAELAKLISLEMAAIGLTALVSLDGDTDERAENSIRDLVSHRVSGVILVGSPYEKKSIAHVARTIPAVYVGRLLKMVDIDSVTTDHTTGSRLAIDHLISRGAREILHVDGGQAPGAERIREGYRHAMRAHGLEDRVRIVKGAYTVDGGARAIRELLGRGEPRPQAIFAASDLAAMGVMNELAREGIEVPRDLLLVGYDDITLAGTSTLSLTTIRQPASALASAGVAAMIQRLSRTSPETEKTQVAPELVVRRTSSPE